MDIETGECAEFSLYHIMDLEDREEGATEVDGPKKKNPNVDSTMKSPSLFPRRAAPFGQGLQNDHLESTASRN
jgi:hypothetical protein